MHSGIDVHAPVDVRRYPCCPVHPINTDGINTDGEVTTRTPAKIDMIPRAIPVLVPQTSPAAQAAEHVAESPAQTDEQSGIVSPARS